MNLPEHFDLLSVACGGGRNTAQLLGMYERGIRPDIITFANTGEPDLTKGEKPETYKAIERISKWCDEKFGVPVTWVRKRSMYSSLYDQSIRTATLPSAATACDPVRTSGRFSRKTDL